MLAFRRDSEHGALICTVNTTGEPVSVPGGGLGVLLLSSAGPRNDRESGAALLEADSTSWWRTD